MDHEGVEPHMVISEVIEDLAQAEGQMQAAKDKMNVPFLPMARTTRALWATSTRPWPLQGPLSPRPTANFTSLRRWRSPGKRS
jgi:hypothetical protein